MELYKLESINIFIICLAIIGIITSSASTLYTNIQGIISGYSITIGSFLILFIIHSNMNAFTTIHFLKSIKIRYLTFISNNKN